MGFGGSAGSMLTVLRNNKKLLKSRKHFDKNSWSVYGEDKTELNFSKASPQVLRSIKSRMQREREIFVRRALLLGAVFVALALILLIFLG